MSTARRWQRAGRDWPNREASQFIEAGGLRWHVQTMGEGPAVLLLHGTGAATHSWGLLAPLLAEHFRVVAPDLPGQGFTDTVSDEQASLAGMAALIGELLAAVQCTPALVVGHSAGAAILARLCLDKVIAPAALVSLNGAFQPFGRMAAPVFTKAARLLAGSTLIPYMVAAQGLRRRSVEKMVEQTGSYLDAKTLGHYRDLVLAPDHVAGTLRMMANWDLAGLWQELPRLPVPLVLVTCENDRAIPPAQAERLAARVRGCRVERVPGLGHLGHEEDPVPFAELIHGLAREYHLLDT